MVFHSIFGVTYYFSKEHKRQGCPFIISSNMSLESALCSLNMLLEFWFSFPLDFGIALVVSCEHASLAYFPNWAQISKTRWYEACTVLLSSSDLNTSMCYFFSPQVHVLLNVRTLLLRTSCFLLDKHMHQIVRKKPSLTPRDGVDTFSWVLVT